MEEKILTDEEIVKALELCVKNDCEKCPYLIKGFDCVISKQAENDSLDLIHRLQDENKLLKEDNEEQQRIIFGLEEEKRLLLKRLDEEFVSLRAVKAGENSPKSIKLLVESIGCVHKDTAKEILQELYDQIDENTPKWVGVQIKIIAKRKGVEVE